jgi:hypothetical protein
MSNIDTSFRRRLPLRALRTALVVVLGGEAIADAQGVREVEIYAEKVREVVHWMPEAVAVVQGETVVIVLHHKLEGASEFHEIAIDSMSILPPISTTLEPR